jgi:hypothetical protein
MALNNFRKICQILSDTDVAYSNLVPKFWLMTTRFQWALKSPYRFPLDWYYEPSLTLVYMYAWRKFSLNYELHPYDLCIHSLAELATVTFSLTITGLYDTKPSTEFGIVYNFYTLWFVPPVVTHVPWYGHRSFRPWCLQTVHLVRRPLFGLLYCTGWRWMRNSR